MPELGTATVELAWTVLKQRKALKTVTYTERGEPTVNLTTGVITTPESTYTMYGMLVNYAQRDIDGNRVMAGDRKLLVPQSQLPAVLPRVGSGITIDTESWLVVTPIESTANDGLWRLQLRRVAGGRVVQ